MLRLGKDAFGEERTAFLHKPRQAGGPLPVAIVLHGGNNSNARAIAPNWRDAFDRQMILVFPNGQLRNKERGAWFAEDGEDRSQIDVIGTLIDLLVAEHGADRSQVFVAGYSSGAMFSWQLLCEEPGWFRGAGMVAHKLREDFRDHCGPAMAKVPFVYAMGTADAEAGYDAKAGTTVGAEDTLSFFVERAGCDPASKSVTQLPDVAGDNTRVDQWDFTGCATPIRYYKINGGGHSWPGGENAKDTRTLCTDLDATQEIMRFWREKAGLGGR